MKCVIFDIDGTLADCQHRIHYISGTNKNWNLFYENCSDDIVIKQVSYLIDKFKCDFKIILLTGRPESNMKLTLDWLDKNNIYFDELVMRKNNDFRKSPEFKKENIFDLINEGYDIFCAFEDRQDCVEMYKSIGVFVFSVANQEYVNV